MGVYAQRNKVNTENVTPTGSGVFAQRQAKLETETSESPFIEEQRKKAEEWTKQKQSKSEPLKEKGFINGVKRGFNNSLNTTKDMLVETVDDFTGVDYTPTTSFGKSFEKGSKFTTEPVNKYIVKPVAKPTIDVASRPYQGLGTFVYETQNGATLGEALDKAGKAEMTSVWDEAGRAANVKGSADIIKTNPLLNWAFGKDELNTAGKVLAFLSDAGMDAPVFEGLGSIAKFKGLSKVKPQVADNIVQEAVKEVPKPQQLALPEPKPQLALKEPAIQMPPKQIKASTGKFNIAKSNTNDILKPTEVNSMSNIKPLNQRLKGNKLLDAEDLITEIKQNGGIVDENGYVKLYHATNKQNAELIKSTKKMSAMEDGLFFSTKSDGQISGYGDSIIELNVPVEKLILDDIFGNEAHLRMPLKNSKQITDISEYLTPQLSGVEKKITTNAPDKGAFLTPNSSTLKNLSNKFSIEAQAQKNLNPIPKLPDISKLPPKVQQNFAKEIPNQLTKPEFARTRKLTPFTDEQLKALAENKPKIPTPSSLKQVAASNDNVAQSATKTSETISQPKFQAPKINNKNGDLGVRSFQQTVKGSDLTTPQVSDILQDEAYRKLQNEDLLSFAKKYVDDNPERAMKVVKSPQPATAESNAIAQELIRRAQNTGRYEEAIDLIETVSKKATDSGQAIQALSMWGRLTPEGMLRYAQRVFDGANVKNPKLNLKLNDELVDYITRNMEEINKMIEGRAKEVKIQKVLTKINESVPPTMLERVSSVQTLFQLLNPKTTVRNLFGNLGFAGIENVKDTVAAGLDKGVSLITKQRTKTLPSLKTQLQGMKKGLKLGIEDVREGINTSNANTQFELASRSMFKSKIGKKFENALNYTLRVPDRAFYQGAYDESIRQQLKAAKLSTPTQAMEEIAHQDALYRTFQDENVATYAFKTIKKGLNMGKEFGLGDLKLKYPKTPANLLVRSIEYSPAGFFKSVIELAKPVMGNPFNQRAFVESTSRALVGTSGLMGTGYLLHKLGIITGKREKDSDTSNLLQQVGIGGYKFNVSALKRFVMGGFNPNEAKIKEGDTLVSYDWLQPMAVGLAMGANISANKMKDATVEEVGMLDSILTSIQEGTNTLAEQSLLRNLTDMFRGNKDLFTVITDSVKEAPASFIPTFVNQIRQLTDNTSRNTYSKEFPKGIAQQFVNKIPFASKTLEPRINTFGKEQEVYQDGSNSLFNVFLNPAFVSKYKPTPEAEMVIDLFTQTGETKQFPRLVKDSFVFQKDKIFLTPKEKVLLQKEVGKKTQQLFSQLTDSISFTNTTPEKQIETLYKKLDEAGDYGKNIIKRQRGLMK